MRERRLISQHAHIYILLFYLKLFKKSGLNMSYSLYLIDMCVSTKHMSLIHTKVEQAQQSIMY